MKVDFSKVLVDEKSIELGGEPLRKPVEKDAPHESRGIGRWRDPSVPKRGWICVGIEDLRGERTTCEMCGVKAIRFVHYMNHPNYDDLAVGCVCAGHMEQDAAAAETRERNLVNAAPTSSELDTPRLADVMER
jgi:hypothetical protein